MADSSTVMMMESGTEKSMITVREQWRWQVQYSRCFTYPFSSSGDQLSTGTAISAVHPLSPLKKNMFRPIWISSSGSSTLSLHPSADGSASSDSIITVSLQGSIIEEHFISKLHFTWPQVSCLSGFPARGSLVVFASYIDSGDEKQKFAMRFSTISETEDFITSLEDILSDKHPKGRASVDAISAISSESEFVPPAISAISSDQSEFVPPAISAISLDQSEFVPPAISAISLDQSEFVPPAISAVSHDQPEFIPAYRPEMPSGMTLSCTSPLASNVCCEDHQESQAPNGVAASENNAVAFPPRFTSLVSSCSAETEHGSLALALTDGPKEVDLKAQIAKYMQDASFLDMVSKVNDVITELGEDFVL